MLERGARLYDQNAALKLTSIYYQGRYDQPVDMFRRIYWLWHAAYNGSGIAFALIGDILSQHKYAPAEGAGAHALRKGMMRDDGYAAKQLGLDYWVGECGARNLEHALHFLTMAEEMGEASSTDLIARLREAPPEL